jgi:hypothetical protein
MTVKFDNIMVRYGNLKWCLRLKFLSAILLQNIFTHANYLFYFDINGSFHTGTCTKQRIIAEA